MKVAAAVLAAVIVGVVPAALAQNRSVMVDAGKSTGIAGSAAAIGGLALMLDLSGPGGISPVGVLWALLAAVSMAVYFILSAKAGTQSPDAGPALRHPALRHPALTRCRRWS